MTALALQLPRTAVGFHMIPPEECQSLQLTASSTVSTATFLQTYCYALFLTWPCRRQSGIDFTAVCICYFIFNYDIFFSLRAGRGFLYRPWTYPLEAAAGKTNTFNMKYWLLSVVILYAERLQDWIEVWGQETLNTDVSERRALRKEMRCGVYKENHGIPAKRFQMAAYSVCLKKNKGGARL